MFTFVKSVSEACQLLRYCQYEIILVHSRGFENQTALDLLKALRPNADSPRFILVVDALDKSKSSLATKLPNGFDGFLEKPFKINHLCDLLLSSQGKFNYNCTDMTTR